MRTLILFITMMLAATAKQEKVPPGLIGKWAVGIPYDVRQPIGLDAGQEDKIKNLKITLTKNHIEVCGKTVPLKSLDVEDLSQEQFLARYNFSAEKIDLRGSHITEVTINRLESTNACGNFEDPGTHLFVSVRKVVMETGNDYFPLKRR